MSEYLKQMSAGCNLKIADGENNRRYAGLVSFKATLPTEKIAEAVKLGIFTKEQAADMIRTQSASKYYPMMAFSDEKDLNGKPMPRRVSVDITQLVRVFKNKVYINLYEGDTLNLTKQGYNVTLDTTAALEEIANKNAFTVFEERRVQVTSHSKTEAPIAHEEERTF